jgi:hypothetical protein
MPNCIYLFRNQVSSSVCCHSCQQVASYKLQKLYSPYKRHVYIGFDRIKHETYKTRKDKMSAEHQALGPLVIIPWRALCRNPRVKFNLIFVFPFSVMSFSSQNRMQTQNIAIVFGPTLLWPKDEAPNMAVSTVFQNQIVEYILLEYKFIFS